VSEAVQLRVGLDVDLERGAVTLDENKSDDARAWALDPSVVRALSAWVKLRGLEKGELLFVGESNQPHVTDRLAERIRVHLWLANVRQEELHSTGTNRRQLRAHDLRGTFVTLSLANGRSETSTARPKPERTPAARPCLRNIYWTKPLRGSLRTDSGRRGLSRVALE
jgi:integrase